MNEKQKPLAYKILRFACIFVVYRRGNDLPLRTVYHSGTEHKVERTASDCAGTAVEYGTALADAVWTAL